MTQEMKYNISKISIRNFRSITKLDIKNNSSFLITCGSNNVGKTNFLRALNLFFEDDDTNFIPEEDIPFHIYSGTRGAGNKATIKLAFRELKNSNIFEIEKVFSETKGEKKLKIEGRLNSKVMTDKEVVAFLENFKFYFIESSNVDLPKLIAMIVNDEILPIGLDRRRGLAQMESLKKLDEFIVLSKSAVKKIEDEMTKIFLTFLNNADHIDTSNWKLQIMFPEYNFLREAIANIITFTLYDSNDRELDSKGSGIQRMILLSLINYIKNKSKKDVIWGIDEPETFLQPGLQKNLFKELNDISDVNQIIIATHSHFFINIQDLNNTYLFKTSKELKEYKRRPGIDYYKLNTELLTGSENEILQEIKNHLGIEKNDSWEIQPFNLVVEGKTDKFYIENLLNIFRMNIPNIIAGDGVDKYAGLFLWIDEYCSELSFKPKVLAIFDRDGEGRNQYNRFKNRKYKNFDLSIKFVDRYDGETFNSIEIEDIITPEIIFPAINRFLRKKKYKGIRKRDQNKKQLAAYSNMPILQFLTDMVLQNNEDKDILNFNELGLKYILSEYILKEINRNKELKNVLKNYPKLIEFLQEIASSH